MESPHNLQKHTHTYPGIPYIVETARIVIPENVDLEETIFGL